MMQPTTQPTAKPPVFGNSVPVFVTILIAAVLGVYAQLQKTPPAGSSAIQSGYTIGTLIGAAIASILFPLLLGWIAYWIGMRSTKAARITACVVAVIFIVGSIGTIVRGSGSAARRAATDAELAAVRQEQAEAFRSGDTEKLAAAGERTAQALSKMGEGESAERKTVSTTMASLVRELNTLAGAQNQAFEKLGGLGGIDPSSVQSEADLDARLTQCAAALEATTANRDYLVAFESKISESLRAANVPEATVESVLKGFRSRGDLRVKQIELAASNLECCSTMNEILGSLKKHWGLWQADAEGRLTFSERVPDADVDAYNKARGRFDQHVAEQETLTSQIADLIAKSQPTPGK